MTADVTLILEGTYPYVAGGVSTWVHQILSAYPDRSFALLHIGAHAGSHVKRLYTVPDNVTRIQEVYCTGTEEVGRRAGRIDTMPPRKTPSRVLEALRRIHLGDAVDDDLIADLAAGDLPILEFLHGTDTFELLYRDLYTKLSPDAPFMDFFWHMRAMHVPLLRLLAAGCPEAHVYHAVSTGYAGLVGAVASYKTGRPLIVTEHGLYAREREMELARATWIKDLDPRSLGTALPSPLRGLWSHYFRMMSRIAYHQAARLVTLSAANKAKQLADGADAAKIMVVPNGVRWGTPAVEPPPPVVEPRPRTGKLQVGFVGRVVPIKDVLTLIRAVGLARDQVDLEVLIIGPEDEDAIYAERCHALVTSLGLDNVIRFLGPQPMAEWYPKLDVVLLTSLSEGQPLVILEAYAAGVPVIATDVGACREMIEGGDEVDRVFGPSGLVTRVANPASTAAAICLLATNPELRATMGRAALSRVAGRYQLQQVVASYDALYARMAG